MWLEGLVSVSTDFSRKNRFFFVFMIGNGRHQALFVGKLYDGLEIPDKMAGFAQKTRGIGKESVKKTQGVIYRPHWFPSCVKTCIEPFIDLLSHADLLRIFLFCTKLWVVLWRFGEVGVDFELNGILWVKLVLSLTLMTGIVSQKVKYLFVSCSFL